ncbi:glyceraldehyde-3-phosphate dehydrogenase 2-like [Sitophilus oryzae]|uniref:Glyceraldehyde-3-phosphate dehydrogenase 2-like n=1 Tax=Sitophilus oryzae TaxID=7048 RepID=A0A6J2XT91_SITOR|nr:glyceraldehyde-3-phosphate dehydrogenase 2-like [Sitophilus oryzae]
MVNVGINGFGRIGRLLVRIALDQCGKGTAGSDSPVIAIVNDSNLSPQCMGYLFKNDSFYGSFKREIIEMDNCILLNGQRIEAVHESNITKIPWNKGCPVEYIIDTTGRNISCASASQHLRESVKRVIVTGNADIPIFIMGVNHTCYKPDMKTVSVSSPSLNCLAAMLRVVHENFKVEKAMATAILPLTNSDKILDDNGGSVCRESRSAIVNFLPVGSAAPGRYVSRVMPELEDKVESTAVKIPVPCVGAVDLTAILGKPASYDLVAAKIKEAADCYMKGVIRYSVEDLVSSDIVGDPHSCVFDSKAGLGLGKNAVKLFGWYDAEYAYAHRLYDLLKYVISREVCLK